MMEVLDDGTYFMNEVQKMLGSETKWAEKKRDYRLKKGQCPQGVLPMSDKSKRESIEKDIDIDKEKENTKESSPSLDSGELFDFEGAFDKTFEIYPKKKAYSKAKKAWLDKLLGVVDENRADVARLIYGATAAYLRDYKSKNPDDTEFRYLPQYADWLTNDCDYWLGVVEKRNGK